MIGGRQNAANLWEGTRVSNRNLRKSQICKEDGHGNSHSSSSRTRSLWDLATFKRWRTGVTGKIYFSVRKELTCVTRNIGEKEEVQSEGSEKLDEGKDDNSNLEVSVPVLVPPPRPSTSMRHEKKRAHIYFEIERCDDLIIPTKSAVCNLFRTKSSRSGNIYSPFVLIRLNGREVGRTPLVTHLSKPFWMDECFRVPVCEDCSCLTFEVWGAVPKDGRIKIDYFLGRCSISVSYIKEGEEMKEYGVDLKRWRHPDSGEGKKSSKLCDCPSQNELAICCPLGGELSLSHKEMVSSVSNRRETIRVRPSKYSFPTKHSRRTSIEIEKPSNHLGENALTRYRVPNRFPYRRRDIEHLMEEKEQDSCVQSTLFKAVVLVCAYLTIGVIGYSCVFENWSIRNSLYFSIVTFTTVGYGDIRPESKSSKAFTCAFALMGIGLIGISLGYIGQNLVQAQVAALQRAHKRPARVERCDSPTFKNGNEKEEALNLNYRKIALLVSPIIIMTLCGSIIMRTYESWSWLDSVYWCIMTGTSVGYGDLVPRSNNMIWFSVVFIPLSVGVISAALGRIANIFVEQEVFKSNTKLLRREVTLEDLEEMNVDGDGEVSPLEFIEHMLKKMHKVDQMLLDKLHHQFEVLDADGSGGLQQDDLDLLTERKLKERRTCALNLYGSMLFRGKSQKGWVHPK